MTLDVVRLTDNRTEIAINTTTGEYSETGASFPKLNRSATDAFLALKLLLKNKQAIIQGYLKENPNVKIPTQQGNTVPMGSTSYGQDKTLKEIVQEKYCSDDMLSERGPGGYSSSVSIDSGLKHDTGLIKPSAGS